MDFVTLPSRAQDEGTHRVSLLCREIEKKARLKGNTAVLMELDRIPNLLLGPANCIPEGNKDTALAEAMMAIERITLSISRTGQRTTT
jgi:hypothetical protein